MIGIITILVMLGSMDNTLYFVAKYDSLEQCQQRKAWHPDDWDATCTGSGNLYVRRLK